MTVVIGNLKSADFITRNPNNPILTHKDILYEAKLVFNAGITKYNGKYVMVFRNDFFEEENTKSRHYTNLGLAYR